MSEKSRRPAPDGSGPPTGPASFLAAAAALSAIDDAVRTAQNTGSGPPSDAPGSGAPDGGPEPALAALVLLRELRTELASWEAGLVDAARDAGATWAELAQPMGVASRQAAENRYLRLRPADSASTDAETGAERVKAVRDRRAAERAVTAWARDHAADLRVLAAQIAAAPDLTPRARPALAALTGALGGPDPAGLIAPLTAMRPHLGAAHPDLAARLDDLTDRTGRLRHDSDRRRT
ncbi:type III effector protein [Kitasatospora aburaviensis]|uniref:Type III effector protein n=1 Tax=Kitasatospora aburaviensis TaxID=67265 RepID=A0ABW1F1V6_9ACTN